ALDTFELRAWRAVHTAHEPREALEALGRALATALPFARLRALLGSAHGLDAVEELRAAPADPAAEARLEALDALALHGPAAARPGLRAFTPTLPDERLARAHCVELSGPARDPSDEGGLRLGLVLLAHPASPFPAHADAVL